MFEKNKLGVLNVNHFKISNLIIIPLCVLMLNTYTIFMKYSLVLRMIFIIGIFAYAIYCRRGISVKSQGQKMWLAFLIYAILLLPFSIDFSSTINMIISILIFSSLLVLVLDQEFFMRLISVWNVLNFICVLSIFVNILIPSLMTGVLEFFVLDVAKETLSREIISGIYSGLFAEKNAAAYGACIGFVFAYSQYMRASQKKYILLSLYYIVAIFLTGKRMAMFIPAMVLLVTLCANRRNSITYRKIRRYFLIMCVAIVVAFISMPQIRQSGTKIIDLFIADGSIDVTNNRSTLLWPVALQMFSDSPLTGMGLNTYNSYIQSVSSSDSVLLSSWGSNAHNIYLQLLGEVGILGATIVFVLFVYNILRSFKLYKIVDDLDQGQLCLISLGLQIVFLIIGITENTFYTTGQVLTYFVAMGIINVINNRRRREMENSK